jgi:hypothetical protein
MSNAFSLLLELSLYINVSILFKGLVPLVAAASELLPPFNPAWVSVTRLAHH